MDDAQRESGDPVPDRVSELAEALLGNSVINQALGAAFGARNTVAGAQRLAMGMLDIPSRSDLERNERRMRTLIERVEALEDELDRVQSDVRFMRSEIHKLSKTNP